MNYPKTTMAVLVGSMLVLSACSSGSSSGSKAPGATATVSGTAANSLLDNATVCIDLNDNLQCDADEPTTQTDADGNFSLSGLNAAEVQDKYLVVEVGAAIQGNSSPGQGNVLIRRLPVSMAAGENLQAEHINPFTTLLDGSDMTLAELANALGVSESRLQEADYSADPAVKNAAAVLAGKIADELAASVTSSAASNSGVLLTGGFLQDMANLLKAQTGLTSAELQAVLDTIEAGKQALDTVVDAGLTLTVNNLDATPIQAVSVLIKAYEAGTNNEIASITGDQLVIGETDDEGVAQINLPGYSQPSIDIDVELQKEGFVTLIKRIKNIAAGDQLPITLAMTEEGQSSAQTTSNFDLPAATAASLQDGSPAFTLALIRMPDGERVLLAGESAAQAMVSEDNDVQVGVQIPLGRIDTDNITALTAGVQGFNPDDPNDSQSFPGSFEGIGHDSDYPVDGVNSEHLQAGAASNGGNQVVPIISTSFAQIRLEDQDGNDFVMTSAQAGAAASAPPVIYLRVPESTYRTITHDANDSLAGIQVPIYVYRWNEGWVLIGLSTLVKRDGLTYEAYEGGLPLTAGIGQLFARIEITEGNNWIRWVNIDWPIIAGDVQSFNYSGRLRYEGVNRERFSGWGNLEFDDGTRQYISISEGRLDYGQLTDATNAATAKLSLYNQYTREYETFEFTDNPAEANSYVLAQNPGILSNPFQCEVFGRLHKDEQPAAWRNVVFTGERFRRQVSSNARGEYRSVVPCNEPVKLSVQNIQKELEVNGVVGANEASDANGVVQMALIELPNQPPQVSAWGSSRVVVAAGGSADVTLNAYAWDADSDSLNFDWSCPGSGASSSSVSARGSQICQVSASSVPQGVDGIFLPWSVTVTDNDGGSTTAASRIFVEVTGRNKAPRISSIQRDNRNLSCSRGSEGTLVCTDRLVAGSEPVYRLVATDPDGDTITYSAPDLSLLPGSEDDGRFELQVLQGTNEYELSATDIRPTDAEQLTTTATLIVTGTDNQPPVVYIGLDKSSYINGLDTTAIVSASMWDDNTGLADLRDSAVVQVLQDDTPVTVPVTRVENRWHVDIELLDIGEYTLEMDVTDSLGAVTTATANFSLDKSQPPHISALTAPASLAINESGVLDNPASSFAAQLWDDADVSDLQIDVELIEVETSISWELTYQLDGYNLTGNFLAVSDVLFEAGAYTLRVTIQDADNDAVTREVAISFQLPNNSADIIIQ